MRRGFALILGLSGFACADDGSTSAADASREDAGGKTDVPLQDSGVAPDTGQADLAEPDSGPPPSPTVPAGEKVRIGSSTERYFDPEILSAENKMVLCDANRTIRLADLDPVTGRFRSDTGKDVQVDTGQAPLRETNNGPELGIDRQEWSILYSKAAGSAIQVWRATVGPVTSEPPNLGPVVSRHPTGDTTRVLAVRGSWTTGTAVAIDLSRPADALTFSTVWEGFDGRWIDDTYLAVDRARPTSPEVSSFLRATRIYLLARGRSKRTLCPPGARHGDGPAMQCRGRHPRGRRM